MIDLTPFAHADNAWRWQSLLNTAHLESHRASPDLKLIGNLLYGAIHLSDHHPDAYFAAFMCWRRVRKWQAMERCWIEATGRGDAAEYVRLAARYH